MVLKKGDKGGGVTDLQAALCKLGYLTQIDGNFGFQTKANLKAFQEHNSLKDDGEYGPLTQAVVKHKIEALPTSSLPTPVSNSTTPWMDWLARNTGQKEISGEKANPFIVDLFRYTSLSGAPEAFSDETPWCAACANAALLKNGYKGTGSAAASSFINYGTKLQKPEYGAVICLPHHVTFFVRYNPQGRMVCLGGNQSNQIKESLFWVSNVLTIRWPEKA